MKKVLSVLGIIVLLSGCGSLKFTMDDAKGKENLIINNSLEFYDKSDTENKDIPTGWVILNSDNEKVLPDQMISLDGKKSLLFKQIKKNVTLVSESFKVSPEYSYYSNCHFRGDKNYEAEIIINFITFDKDGKILNRYITDETITEEWNRAEISCGFFDEKTEYARIMIKVPAKTTTWIDKIGAYPIYKFKKK